MATITHYDQGDVWTPQATFTVNGTPTDPTTLVLKVKDPSGVVTTTTENTPATPTLPIVRVSAGVFKHAGISLNDAGYWFVRFEGTGAAAATEEAEAIVDPSEFYESAQLGARALVGFAETKDWLQGQGAGSSDTINDLELARVINDVSVRAHQEARREFKVAGTNPQSRTFDVDDTNFRTGVIYIGDATSITLVEIIDWDWQTVIETAAASEYLALPSNRQEWEPIRRIRFNYRTRVTPIRWGYRVRVTGNFGFPAVPGDVRQAVLNAIAATIDRNVEQYRQDLTPVGAPEGGAVLARTQLPLFLSMPASSLAVLWDYRDIAVG